MIPVLYFCVNTKFVTHLVHTQGYDSPQQYAEVVAQLDGEIRAAL